MQDFLYRLSWDKDLKNKVVKWSCISFCSFACVFALVVVCVGNFVKPKDDDEYIKIEQIEDAENDDIDITFKEHFQDVDKSKSAGEKKEEREDRREEGSGGTGGGGGGTESYNPGGGDVPGHVHSWYTVIDSYPWDESIWIQTGTTYICNGCGYTTNSSSDASAHSDETGHKFRSEAIMEERIIHHSGSSHEECACGARR